MDGTLFEMFPFLFLARVSGRRGGGFLRHAFFGFEHWGVFFEKGEEGVWGGGGI